MKNSDQIFVVFTSNFPGLFRNVSKFILYLNTLFTQESDGGLYLEMVDEGILYIYQNKTIFDSFNPHTSKAEISKLISDNDLQLKPGMLIEGIIDKHTFPEGGIEFRYNFHGSHNQHAYNKLLSFHQSLYGENIRISNSSEHDLILSIRKFDDFYLFVKQMALLANGIKS